MDKKENGSIHVLVLDGKSLNLALWWADVCNYFLFNPAAFLFFAELVIESPCPSVALCAPLGAVFF